MVATIPRFTIYPFDYRLNINDGAKREGVPRNPSNWSIWGRKCNNQFQLLLLLGKMKSYVRLQGYQGPQGAFPDKVTTDINRFTHEPVI